MVRSALILLLLALAGCASQSDKSPADEGPATAETGAAVAPEEAPPWVKPSEERTGVTMDDLVKRDRVIQARISPDGGRVAYVVLTPDFEENKYRSDIWIVTTATGETVRCTNEDALDTNPAWSPDGTLLAFVSSRSGKKQIWTVPAGGDFAEGGGDARQVTDLAVAASRPVWSPDGKTIAFMARKSPKDEEDAASGDEEEKKKGYDAKVYTALEDREKWAHIWTVNIAGVAEGGKVKPRRVTTEPFVYEDLAWSPDGATLAFTCDEVGTRAVSEDSYVAVMPADGGPIRRLTREGIFAGAPSWSHDGRRIAYLRDRSVDLGAYLNVKDLYVHDLEANQSYCLTFMADVSVGGFYSIPHHPATWSADDAYLYVLGAAGPTQNIYRVSSLGGPLEPVSEVNGEIYAPTFSKGAERTAFLMGSFTQVREVFTSDVADFEPLRLTCFMDQVERLGFREPEPLRFRSHDGLEIEGFLFYPDGYPYPDGSEAGTRVPLVVDIHGGPASRWGAQIPRYTPWKLYNHLGIAVLIVNPRGSTAYGAEFQRGNYRGFGLGDLEDIMAGVDHVIAMGVADPDRLGVTGYSYGGFMTNNIITRTDRFKAAVSIAGGANYISCYLQANPVLPRVFYDGPPWGKTAELYFKHSPVVRAGLVTTPTLFMHGENDRAVHVSQSIEFFRALAEAGVETELVIYPREGHGISEPVHWRDYMQRTVDWFTERLLN